jgi:hypothetical protein
MPRSDISWSFCGASCVAASNSQTARRHRCLVRLCAPARDPMNIRRIILSDEDASRFVRTFREWKDLSENGQVHSMENISSSIGHCRDARSVPADEQTLQKCRIAR